MKYAPHNHGHERVNTKVEVSENVIYDFEAQNLDDDDPRLRLGSRKVSMDSTIGTTLSH